ncbi:MAG: bifunctional DNA-formamidopyrimidine glycosylase/DNA-(apurinic or apyrimidinic site) lyase [Bryobacterales bacterium]|nr:bifunctional DNA-formamidopyrimidine glycosylase/DNA-(apurinic or apyrimidinic site) lyase [Bryobacterales bacterium]
MPELPEVETIARMLAPRLAGRRVRSVRLLAPEIVEGDVRRLGERLRGRIVEGIRRRGKYLLVQLDGAVLTLHLGMTGRLRWDGRAGPHTRAIIVFDRGRLLFDDPRKFGSIAAGEGPSRRVLKLGPEALSISARELAARIRGRRAPIKTLLMDQRILAGVGNIYSDEALFRARIHPRTPAGRLSFERVKRLHRALRRVLREAIAAGGSSVSDYVNADDEPGWFQFEHRVYRRTGQPCLRCGAPIRRIVMAQRSTHFCPRCQRL